MNLAMEDEAGALLVARMVVCIAGPDKGTSNVSSWLASCRFITGVSGHSFAGLWESMLSWLSRGNCEIGNPETGGRDATVFTCEAEHGSSGRRPIGCCDQVEAAL